MVRSRLFGSKAERPWLVAPACEGVFLCRMPCRGYAALYWRYSVGHGDCPNSRGVAPLE